MHHKDSEKSNLFVILHTQRDTNPLLMTEKMRIDILSVMPEALDSPLHCSILQRAQDKGLVDI